MRLGSASGGRGGQGHGGGLFVYWVAVSFGALDVADAESFESEVELVVTPTKPADPVGLIDEGAELWRRLAAHGPLREVDLSPEERATLQIMESVGIAARDEGSPYRQAEASRPWLSSPLHELVYALVQRVADQHGVPCVFIKGPVLREQGLRDREHSGDVDVWVKPGMERALADALEVWGWRRKESPDLRSVYHSVTMAAGEWGCEIDLHFRFPGMAADDDVAFEVLRERSEVRPFAGVGVRVPDTGAHAVIAALHLLRPEPGRVGAASARHDQAVAALAVEPEEALSAAHDFGAVGALREALRDVGADDSELSAAAAPDWEMRASAGSSAHLYLRALRGEPWRRRVTLLLRAVWPTTAEVWESDARASGAPSRSLWQARRRRFGRGWRQIMRRGSARG